MPQDFWDLSPPIRTGIPVWPGDTAYSESRNWAIGPGCPVNVSKFTMSTHTGSHADAPFHYAADGLPVGGLDLARYVGPCRLLDVTSAGALVERRHIDGRIDPAVPRLLFRTYAQAPLLHWDEDFTAIAADAIEHMAAHGVVLVGTDTPSLDPQTSKTMDAHMAVKRHGLSILEGLVLDGIPEGDYELIALPLKLADLDAAPVRAILRPLARP
ncbi:MAG: arylformamidase [Rhodospirillaceae bacterium]|nr:arylformamidase [Rhodospirillaceae bacterium]